MSDTFEFDDKSRVERLVGTLHDPGATVGDVLTVQAGGGIAAAPGGGSGGVQVVTVPVSSAQILDLFNTPVVLVPSVPGAITVVDGVVLIYLAGLVPYLDGGGNIIVQSPASGNNIAWSTIQGAGFWDGVLNGAFNPATSNGGAFPDASSDVLLLQDTANPTLGDGTLLVTVSYFLAPTV